MQLVIFKYEDENSFNNLTTLEINGEMWFVANEICDLLDIKNGRDAVSSLEEDEKTQATIPLDGVNRTVNLVNESGLYNLIFRSKKETAKKFRKWVTKEVLPSIRKTGSYGINRLESPNFVRRFSDNWDRTDRGYFSVISELYVRLYGKLEMVGYQIPNKAIDGVEIRPDVSVGRLFRTYLTKNYPELADNFKMYSHKFPNGQEFDCKQYPNDMLPIFIKYVDEVWIPEHSARYLGERDRLALDYLPKLLKA